MRRVMIVNWIACALIALFVACSGASAQTSPPGVGVRDSRAAIDVTQAPWSSVVRVNTAENRSSVDLARWFRDHARLVPRVKSDPDNYFARRRPK